MCIDTDSSFLQISGWTFDDLAITIKQRLCEALLGADRVKEACESVLRMVDEEIKLVKTWVFGKPKSCPPFQLLRRRRDHLLPDFKCRCYSKLEDLGDSALNARQYDGAISQYTAALSLDPADPQDLLMKRSNAWMGKGAREDALNDAKEWTRLMLTSDSWKDALTAAVGASILSLGIRYA